MLFYSSLMLSSSLHAAHTGPPHTWDAASLGGDRGGTLPQPGDGCNPAEGPEGGLGEAAPRSARPRGDRPGGTDVWTLEEGGRCAGKAARQMLDSLSIRKSLRLN